MPTPFRLTFLCVVVVLQNDIYQKEYLLVPAIASSTPVAIDMVRLCRFDILCCACQWLTADGSDRDCMSLVCVFVRSVNVARSSVVVIGSQKSLWCKDCNLRLAMP